jgi:Spy/CpxP family protein refolding chaperone
MNNQDQSENSRTFRTAKMIFVAVMVCTIALGIQAYSLMQEGPPPGGPGPGGHWQPPTAEEQTARLTKLLSLTEEQQGKVKAILEEQHQQTAKMREDSSTAPEDRFAKMKEMREKVHNQIKDVLNEDQKKKFAEWEQQRSDRMRHRRESAPDDKDKPKDKE